MPCSGYEIISPVMNKVRKIAFSPPYTGNRPGINTIIDLGVGMGQWGFCFRTYLDYYCGRIHKENWKTVMLGVESFESYRCPTWDLYDSVHIGDIREFVTEMPSADLVSMIEVLEHFTKEDGIKVLTELKKRARHIITGFFNGDQGPVHGNEHEVHRSKWTFEELKEIFPNVEYLSGDSNGMLVYVDNRSNV